MKTNIFSLLAFSSIILLGCSNSQNKESINTEKNFEVSVQDDQENTMQEDLKTNPDVIFYNLFSPLDLDCFLVFGVKFSGVIL